MELILATNNKGKVREYKEILEPLGFCVTSQGEAGINIEAEETGKTFSENAYIKAKAIYDIKKTYVLADDSGLVVDALDGRPGVYSARYAEPGKRCDKILSELEGVSFEKRTARFLCSICLIKPNGDVLSVEGRCEGRIGYDKKGENGFGYDPIFLFGDKTLAEMTDDEKNSVSHRGNAVKALIAALKDKGEE